MTLHIPFPDHVAQIMAALGARGFAAYLVGGCVRDSLSGTQPHDFDIASAALPSEVRAALPEYTVIDTGAAHGTVTAVAADGKTVEITTFRTDGEYADFRRPRQVSFCRDIKTDLARRDFTINAMAYSPDSGLIDPFGGRDDLDSRVLRCVGDPVARFHEDALRIFRALRFCSVLGFDIEPATRRAVFECAPLLTHIAAERLTAEFRRLLCGKNACSVLADFKPVLSVFIPELEKIPDNMLPRIGAVAPDFSLRLGALLGLISGDTLSDLGTPPHVQAAVDDCCRTRQSRATAPASIGSGSLSAVLRMKLDNRTKSAALQICEHCGRTDVDPAALIKKCGYPAFCRIIDINRALYPQNSALWDALADSGALISSRCTSVSELAANGRDMLTLGCPPIKIGRLLDFLLTEVMYGRLENQKQPLLCAARRFLSRDEF